MKINMDLFVTTIGKSLLLILAIYSISLGLMDNNISLILTGIFVTFLFVIHLNLDINFIEFQEKKKK